MKSKSLIALGAITTLLSVQTVNAIPLREVKEFVCAGGVKKTVQETSAEAKMSWIKREMKKLQEQLKGSALEYSINAPTAHLSDVNFDFGVNRSSEQTISGKYSQADVWRLGLSTNLLSSSDPGFGLKPLEPDSERYV